MGFMGLKRVNDVDGASDLKYSLLQGIQDRFAEELEDEGNEYNPPGFINILLVLKEEPNLARYLSHTLVKKIDHEVDHIIFDAWVDCEDDLVTLCRSWRKNPVIKKALK